MESKMKAGIIGCGNISAIYLENLKKSAVVEVAACADVVLERAESRAAEYGIANVYTVADLLADPSIELVINLTIPGSHADIDIAALEAGKHVYAEKPLAVSLADGKRILEVAESKGLRVGSAPDTFLGSGVQTAKAAIESGMIGKPVAAVAFMMSGGPEGWHPDPEFFYAPGGGPMFDMGPYYLTALAELLGPMHRISSSAGAPVQTRTIGSGPKAGTQIPVLTPTHLAGTIDFKQGAIATVITSFDIKGGADLPWLEIYGTEGTLILPDPNFFDGDVKLRRSGSSEAETLAPVFECGRNERGLGVNDMVKSIREGRNHRAGGELAYHVLEAMHAFQASSLKGEHVVLESTLS
ncbi:Gfo/Idh/MocA family oxidoreductase [Paenibacillus sp. VCA1]|uniref:Gfo/Idh/MocA family protein n=1 Tax=Paenibacillus sp. VCA1 TaxID=3039148 RepID=UPI002871E30A|nr:Gfo/Idh/MocA family oxidoreductase [Paenibacillus sp. VCA1]MDR9852750.1 Gfo/Idh/MocA family oxidoreductase [Paenibacillus sp. VCA1]